MVVIVLFSPAFVFASGQGLVPCAGVDCTMCDFGELIYNVMNTVTIIFGILLTLMIVVGGTYLAVSVGNAEVKTTVKRILSQGIIGYIIMLTAWTATDALVKMFLVDDGQIGIWEGLDC